MPTQYRVGRDNRCNLHHTAATEARAAGSQPPPVVVREPHAVGAQLRLQDAILLPQLLDDLLLLVQEPADNEGDQLCSGTTRRVYVYAGSCFRTLL
jgi:hypothetical protein